MVRLWRPINKMRVIDIDRKFGAQRRQQRVRYVCRMAFCRQRTTVNAHRDQRPHQGRHDDGRADSQTPRVSGRSYTLGFLDHIGCRPEESNAEIVAINRAHKRPAQRGEPAHGICWR
ncbi:hypothetical protein MAHJHV53_12820 [Mycobacterium avium subsp. hominissuis]|uniref:C2H2-type domain-containing protein n=1 Tax=Mycobacterium paraffinicum TaxID=53378 RepID=A0ABP8F2Y7_9MYCO